jgi:preprotein translocase subunit SecD
MKLLRLALALSLLPVLFCGCDRTPKHGVEFTVAVASDSGGPVDSNEVQRVAATLRKRMDSVGRRWSVQPVSSISLLKVKFSPKSPEEVDYVRALLTRRGQLEFRLVHEENQKWVAQGITPVGYELRKQSMTSYGGAQTVIPLLISKERMTGVSGANISRAAVGRDNLNRPEILFTFDAAGAAAFAQITATNVNRQLAIILDGEVYSAPMIKSPITGGNGSITGDFTEREAREFATVLQSPLAAPVQFVDEKTF